MYNISALLCTSCIVVESFSSALVAIKTLNSSIHKVVSHVYRT